ncbi:MAG TPA: glucose-6-phosphate isomerase [Dehalococcoidia bacterium]|nr:glucose-6-phosphate isomerase [Dehalococcoidia bacterium]
MNDQVRQALEDLSRDRVVQRIWDGDHTLWSDDPTEITEPNRLGWLDVAEAMRDEVPALRRFAIDVAGDGYRKAVLFGMGGSSLAPEVLQRTFGTRPGLLELEVMDSTHPDAVLDLADRLDLQRTLFIVASKSGSTIETLTHFEYFWSMIPDGRHFAAITDEGSALHRLGGERGFRQVFLNRPTIGGRYSALSFFGLVPAALIGANLDELVSQGVAMAASCRNEDPAENPGALLGAAIGEAAIAGRDKLTLLQPQLASFGDWVEQLIAESTGKSGKGIVPVVGESPAPARIYGDDRLFVALGEQTDVAGLEAEGHPVVKLPPAGKQQLGAEFFRWEFATAVAGQRLRINPFDQPNVQSAKDATARILESNVTEAVATPGFADVLATVQPGDYIAVLAYLPRNPAIEAEVQALRLELRDRYLVATTLGFGPRYLHSTGQLHKGGPNNGVFILLTDDPVRDAEVPGRPYTFGRLHRAQALGDLQSLVSAGRRVAHVALQGDRTTAIKSLRSGFN